MSLSAPKPSSLTSQILGYTIAEPVYLGSRTAVYRAVQTAQQRPVVIKMGCD